MQAGIEEKLLKVANRYIKDGREGLAIIQEMIQTEPLRALEERSDEAFLFAATLEIGEWMHTQVVELKTIARKEIVDTLTGDVRNRAVQIYTHTSSDAANKLANARLQIRSRLLQRLTDDL
jgi:hypothetical protein